MFEKYTCLLRTMGSQSMAVFGHVTKVVRGSKDLSIN